MSLRSKFLLIALAAGVLPLAVVGLWLTGRVAESGRTLLQTQLSESLARAVARIEARWPHVRADLLLLAENETIVRALSSNDREADDGAREYLLQAFEQMPGRLARATFRDASDSWRWTVRLGGPTGVPATIDEISPAAAPAVPTVRLTYPVGDPGTGVRLGTLEAHVLIETLLPLDVPVSEVPGSVFALFDRRDGRSLLPTALDAELLRGDAFGVDGDRWIAVRRPAPDLPLDLAVAAPVSPYVNPSRRAAQVGVVGLVVVLGGGALAVGVLTRRLTTSLEEMAVAADALAEGDLGQRVAVRGRDEVGRVAVAFNTMAASMRRMLRRRAQQEALVDAGEFAASLAHEVRNPLTSVRMDLQNARRAASEDDRLTGLLDRSLSQVDRLDDAVGGALSLVRSGRVRRDAIDLRVPLRAAIHAARPELERGGIALWAEDVNGPQAPLQGDANALERLFLNVLLNASQAFGADAEQPTVAVAIERGPGEITVEILDNGRGIADQDLRRVLEPFFSTKEEGTGLGLAISRQIVRAHGGELEILSRPGSGTRVRIRLPEEGWGPAIDDASSV